MNIVAVMMAQEHKVVSDTFMVNWWCRLNFRAEIVVQAMQMVHGTTQPLESLVRTLVRNSELFSFFLFLSSPASLKPECFVFKTATRM